MVGGRGGGGYSQLRYLWVDPIADASGSTVAPPDFPSRNRRFKIRSRPYLAKYAAPCHPDRHNV